MGILSKSKSPGAAPEPLPSGSFTVDRSGQILTSTIRSGVPREKLDLIARLVLDALRRAREKQIPVQELAVEFAGMTLKARDLRGGAIIFLTPKKSAV